VLFALPGFSMEVRGVWCLVTAGHSIQELEAGLASRKQRLTNCCLVAHLGRNPLAEQTIPFDFQLSGKLWVNEEADGLDFALLTLTSEQRVAVAAKGIRPIREENWNRQDLDACEVFALLGLPRCLVGDHARLEAYGEGVAGVVNPVLVPVRRTQLQPDELPESTFPWFVGVVGAEGELQDIVGMSGGPIFGMFKGTDGRLRYWIVAIQSRWDKVSRTILGGRQEINRPLKIRIQSAPEQRRCGK
jgi:hypothetical protein